MHSREASSYRTGSLRTGGRRTSRNEILRSWAVPRRWGPGIIKCESSTSAGASAWSCGASRNLPACTTRAGSRRLSLSRPVVGSRGPPFFSRFLCARLLFNYGCLHFTFLGCPLRGLRSNPPKPAKKALHVSRGVQKPAISSLGVVWMTRFCLRPSHGICWIDSETQKSPHPRNCSSTWRGAVIASRRRLGPTANAA